MKYTKTEVTVTSKQNDSSTMHNSVPVRMLIACFFSCILGIVLMVVTARYQMVGVFICILACIFITTPLLAADKISIETACLAPMLLLCFVYTPISWFTFDGLLGCTPYLSILFFTLITLTYYSRIQIFILFLYTVLMLGLTIHWFVTWSGERDMIQIINILVAYILTVTLIVNVVEAVKRKNHETNKLITNISTRDDLTGLLNRRTIKQVLDKLESVFIRTGAEYATIILDIDQFKNINDLYGHNLGDLALKNVAACIQKSIRSTDYAFRFGGDEFLLVLPNTDKITAYQTCTSITIALSEIQGYDFMITASMGCALRSESSNITVVMELADQRMYQAKRNQNKDKPIKAMKPDKVELS